MSKNHGASRVQVLGQAYFVTKADYESLTVRR